MQTQIHLHSYWWFTNFDIFTNQFCTVYLLDSKLIFAKWDNLHYFKRCQTCFNSLLYEVGVVGVVVVLVAVYSQISEVQVLL